MKKYLLVLFCSLLLFGGYSFAGNESTQPKKVDVSSAVDPCRTLVSPSIGGGACSLKPEDDKKACAASPGTASDPTNKCSQRYSCESLFESDNTKANTCNFNRCEKQRGVGADYCTCKYGAKGDGKNMGIPLNTSMPFIGNCLHKSNSSDPNDTAATSAFPTIISVATRMLITVILLVSFVMVIVGGVQRASGNASEGKKRITKVAIGFALLGLMGAILRLINPNFFK